MLLEKEASGNNWRKTFRDLQETELSSERFTSLTSNVADQYENFPLNRYYDVTAYDHSRVIVHHDGEEIYINANLVKVPDAKREYILTQGPLENTVDDFWLMVFQQACSTLVMLCNCVEQERAKCWQYWPLEVGHTMVLGEDRHNLGLEVVMDGCEDRNYFIMRTFTLTHTPSGQQRKIQQFHYVDWPDFNVPDSPDHFLEFLVEVRKSNCFLDSCGPPVVHCSAGIGRSGTLALVDSCLVLAKLEQEEISLERVLGVLLDMRTCRGGLIQTEDQLRFSVAAIVQGMRTDIGGVSGFQGKRVTREEEGEGEGARIQEDVKKRKSSRS